MSESGLDNNTPGQQGQTEQSVVPPRTVEFLHTSPREMTKPLILRQTSRRAFAAVWLWVRVTDHGTSNSQSQGSQTQVSRKEVLCIVRDDGRVFSEDYQPGDNVWHGFHALQMTPKLPDKPHASHLWSLQGVIRYRQGTRPDPQHVFKRIVDVVDYFMTASIARAGARKRRRLLRLLCVGWLPPSWRPSGAGLALGTRVWCRLFTPSRVTPNRGGVSGDAQAQPRDHRRCMLNGRALCRQRALLGHGRHTRTQCPRDGDNDRVGLLPAGAARSGAVAEASLRLPTAIVDRLGSLRQAAVQRPAACGGGARGPGAVDQGPAGRALARLGGCLPVGAALPSRMPRV